MPKSLKVGSVKKVKKNLQFPHTHIFNIPFL